MLLITDGNPPVNLLFAKCNDSKEKSEFVEAGTSPEKSLLDKSMNIRFCKSHKQLWS
uniref:Uncharacterized protein n=1 Tax=Arundo donax TaxID=35708 RepID=A0A0A9DQX7_ARUDO